MPTGYTAPLHDGQDITFDQFALRCSRAMGAAVMQRDESIDVEIKLREVEGYYQERVDKARAEVLDAESRNHDEWLALQEKEIHDAAAAREKEIIETAAIRHRYVSMLRAVERWTPPTDEHFGLKRFMIDQLTESLKFDCGGWPVSNPWFTDVPSRVSAAEYKARVMARLMKNLDYATTALSEEYARVRSQNEWVTALRESLAVSG